MPFFRDVLSVYTKLASTKLVQDENLHRLLSAKKWSGVDGVDGGPSGGPGMRKLNLKNILTISSKTNEGRTELVTHIVDVLDALFTILMSNDGDLNDDDDVFQVG